MMVGLFEQFQVLFVINVKSLVNGSSILLE